MTVLRALWAHGKRHVEMDGQLVAGDRRFTSVEAKLDAYRKTEDRRHDMLDRKIESMHGDIRDLSLYLKLRKPGNGFGGVEDGPRQD